MPRSRAAAAGVSKVHSEGPDSSAAHVSFDGSVERTAHIIADNGFEVDFKLWEADYARCGPARPAPTATDPLRR
ncbi:hypothetical protein ABZX95_46715 [Streptomyces sp. NPDC004232]|uniref:hypothetical protein n=1 Tax=Streptomyces sp. NPDC004232 TaxID=3154454 RepID=UPI001D9128D1|nr:hypothetical protein [Streptomyces sp. tea 10]